MNVKFILQADDIIHFNTFHCKNSPSEKRNRIIFRMILIVVITIMYFYCCFNNYTLNSFIEFSPLFMIGIVWMIFFNKIYFLMIKRGANNSIKEGDNSGIFGEYSLTIRNDIMTVKNNASVSDYKINKIYKIMENDDYLFIYIASIKVLIIPKIFLDDSKTDKIKLLLNKKQ
jgi:YcxB-like protein